MPVTVLLRNSLLLFALLLLVPVDGFCQFPGADGLIQTPKITLGGGKSTAEKVEKVLNELEEAQERLFEVQGDPSRWGAQLESANKRLEELERLRLKLTGKKPPGNIDPALLPQVETSTIVMNELVDTLTFLVETYGQEQHEVSEGLRHARRLSGQLRAPAAPAAFEEQMSFNQVLQYMSDLRGARVSLSLLKARRAGLKEELEQSLKETGPSYDLVPLPEFAGDKASRQKTLELRKEARKTLPSLAAAKRELRKHIAGHIKARLQRVRLEIYERQEELTELGRSREQVFSAVVIGEKDLEAGEERLKAAATRISEEGRKVRGELKRLRLNPPEDEGGGTFTAIKEWEIRVAVLQHSLYLLDVELQVEEFRAGALVALEGLVRGKAPPSRFAEGYAWYLDKGRQEKARAELARRREAWRQEYAHLSLEKPARLETRLAAGVLEGYQEILDLYGQIDARKWEIEWCAELVRHYQNQYELTQRGVLWYAWRSGVSVLMFVIAIFLSVLFGRATLRPLKKRPDAPNWARYGLFFSYVAGVLFLWTFLSLVTLTNVWGALFGFPRVGDLFSKVLFTIGDKEVTLYAFASLLGVVALTVIVNRFLSLFLRRQVFSYFSWDVGVQHAIQALVKYLVLFVGFALGLEFVGIGFGVLAVFAGVIGIGIGFGLQAIASNFISGFTILFERPIKKGDFVDAGGLEGRVEEIRGRATTLVTRDNVSVIVPNSEFIGGRVVNWSHGSDDVRLHVPVGVAYGSDVKLVSGLLLEVAGQHKAVLKAPAPEVWFMGFGEFSLDFELLLWTNDVEDKYQTVSEINYAVEAIFRENGITIPFPQQDVHIKREGVEE